MKKHSKYENLSHYVSQNFAHSSTVDIIRRRNVLEYASNMLQAQIIDLQTQVSAAKAKLRENEARLAGMTAVIDKR